MQFLGPSYWGVTHCRLSWELGVCLPCTSLSSGLGLGWPASFGFVVRQSPIVWSVSALMSLPLSPFMRLSASVSVQVMVPVLGLALGLGLGLGSVSVSVSALALT